MKHSYLLVGILALMILTGCCGASSCKAQAFNLDSSYWAVGLQVRNTSGLIDDDEVVDVAVKAVWLIPIGKNVYIGPTLGSQIDMDSTSIYEAGASVYLAGNNFGTYLEFSYVPQFNPDGEPNFTNFPIGIGFVSPNTIMGMHPTFGIKWTPDLEDRTKTTTTFTFGVVW